MSWKIPNTKKDFISGFFYYKICDWSFCPRYPQNLEIKEIKENDLIFINLDYFNHFLNILRSNRPKNKFILVTQNSDRDFTEPMLLAIKEYTSKILAINCTVSDEIINKIPLGFNDHSTEVLEKIEFDLSPKENLVYLNFKKHHHIDRPVCFDYFSKFDWITVENNFIDINTFYETLKTFKYCISPRGTGIDTHRIYESLLFGVIPVVKSSTLDDLYKNLPIVIVNDWTEVTEEFLVDNYDSNLQKYNQWLISNPNWYKSEYWIKK
jgi:hypothetical protein